MALVVVQPIWRSCRCLRKGDLTNHQTSLKPSQHLSRRREGFVWVRTLPKGYLSWYCGYPHWRSLVDLPQAGVLCGTPIVKVCWVIPFARGSFVPCQKSTMGRILVTSLGKCCKSKLLDWPFCQRKHSGYENWRGKALYSLLGSRSIFVVWTVMRSFILKAYPTLSFGVLGNDFKCLFLFGANGILKRKLSYIIIWGLQGISKDYFHFLFILNKKTPLRYGWRGKDTIIGIAVTSHWILESQHKVVAIVP